MTDGHKLLTGDILYETAGVSNLYLEIQRLLLVEFTPAWFSWEFPIAEYAIAVQVSRLDDTSKSFAQIR